MKLSVLLCGVAVSADVPAHQDPRCACVNQATGHMPEAWYNAGTGANFPRISAYGTSCSLWDQMPGTPFFEGSCNLENGADYCADSWCQSRWCYVDPSCPSAVTFTPGWASPGVSVTYSYETCGNPNCWVNPDAAGCPFDPEHRCDGTDPCKCLYGEGGLPESMYKGGTHENSPIIGEYGASCSAMDMVAGTPWFDDYCDVSKGADICANSWCLQKWCYVDQKCPGAIPINSGWWAPDMKDTTMYYSYTTCGNPDCFSSSDDPGCPYDPRGVYGCNEISCADMKKSYKDHECCGNPAKKFPKPTFN